MCMPYTFHPPLSSGAIDSAEFILIAQIFVKITCAMIKLPNLHNLWAKEAQLWYGSSHVSISPRRGWWQFKTIWSDTHTYTHTGVRLRSYTSHTIQSGLVSLWNCNADVVNLAIHTMPCKRNPYPWRSIQTNIQTHALHRNTLRISSAQSRSSCAVHAGTSGGIKVGDKALSVLYARSANIEPIKKAKKQKAPTCSNC